MATNVNWQDAHFETARPEYEAILRSVGLQRGWHVLDVGAGRGTMLRGIAEAVGPTGRITAFDLSAEDMAFLDEVLPHWALDCPVTTQVGNMLSLPYPD